MNIAFDAIEGVVRSLFFTSAERNRERDDGIESISIFPSTLADFVVQEPSPEETIPIEEVSTVDEGPLLPDFGDRLFVDKKEVKKFVNEWARANGFNLIVDGGNNNCKLRLVCDCSGTYKSKAKVGVATRKNQLSKKIDCKYGIQCHLESDGKVLISAYGSKSLIHNHPLTRDVSFARALTDEETHHVTNLLQLNCKPKYVLQSFKEIFPEKVINAKKIYNLKRKITGHNSNEHASVTELLVKILNDQDVIHSVLKNHNQQLTGLFIAMTEMAYQ